MPPPVPLLPDAHVYIVLYESTFFFLQNILHVVYISTCTYANYTVAKHTVYCTVHGSVRSSLRSTYTETEHTLYEYTVIFCVSD